MKLLPVSLFAAALMSFCPDQATAGWLRDKILGTDVKQGIQDFIGCVGNVQSEFGTLSQVLLLEGVADDISIEMRRNDSGLNPAEADDLKAAHEHLKICRKALRKTARKDEGMTHVLKTSFGRNDKIYADLLDGNVSVAIANEYLVKSTDLALSTIAKLKNIELDAQRRAGLALMKQGFGMMNPSEPSPPQSSNYSCYSNGSTTNCNSIQNNGTSKSKKFTCYTSGGITNCRPIQ